MRVRDRGGVSTGAVEHAGHACGFRNMQLLRILANVDLRVESQHTVSPTRRAWMVDRQTYNVTGAVNPGHHIAEMGRR